jgi:hypothetical protein
MINNQFISEFYQIYHNIHTAADMNMFRNRVIQAERDIRRLVWQSSIMEEIAPLHSLALPAGASVCALGKRSSPSQ